VGFHFLLAAFFRFGLSAPKPEEQPGAGGERSGKHGGQR
jgi:hypothetical protein